jgi:hypothetical protein
MDDLQNKISTFFPSTFSGIKLAQLKQREQPLRIFNLVIENHGNKKRFRTFSQKAK